MTADRHVAWYGEAMAIQAGFQQDDMSGLGDESAEASARETALMRMISQTPPQTPAEAAAMLRFWLATIRGDEGSKWTGELDLLAMSNVAEFLEALPAGNGAVSTYTAARLRDLELRVKRAEMHIEELFEKGRQAA